MPKAQITVIDSWKLSVRNEILADIQHSLDGLAPGTILHAEQSDKSWKVIARTIFIQAENQKRFKSEKENFQHFVFRPAENLALFQAEIAQKEKKGIHQYIIQPIGHEDKPLNGEKLIVLSQ